LSILKSISLKVAGVSGWKQYQRSLDAINRRKTELANCSDDALQTAAARSGEALIESFAIAAIVAERVLGQRPFDVQILGALAMVDGKIAEMQTGEGKTLAATMAVFHLAKSRRGCHVLTANDYLARRDAGWMGGIYRFLGLSVGHVAQGMDPDARRRAYACDITYATANEVGFDYLRDGSALRTEDRVQRPFETALIDEADSILIDEARIPLVIAGGDAPPNQMARRMAEIVRKLQRGRDYTLDPHARNVGLTDVGIRTAEIAAGCSNLYEPANGALLTALQNALHAEVMLHRDVDYLVKRDRIELVDEFKGRIAENRRWPAELQTALEAKEGIELQKQGRVLGSITLQNLVSLYNSLCGMTGTAATQAKEFKEIYDLDVVAIPTNRPVIREDHIDEIFETKSEKEAAVIEEITNVHAVGRPVLVGTASVAESERLSAQLRRAGIPHEVLNARNDERESHIVARAGALGAVTISTNMAGRGTDIPLGGEQVVALGGLHVIGTNRHESRRIDHQLRGRAGRQGDPGSSRFFISTQDDLLSRYGVAQYLSYEEVADAIETVQSIIEDENLQIRQMLWKYEILLEQHRRIARAQRDELLESGATAAELVRLDDIWADYLARTSELRDGVAWISLAGKNPYLEFLRNTSELFERVLESFHNPDADERAADRPDSRGATWTYLVNDQPFGSITDRLVEGLRSRLRARLEKRRAGKHRRQAISD
jgi:preprotein translocase subunit SecA